MGCCKHNASQVPPVQGGSPCRCKLSLSRKHSLSPVAGHLQADADAVLALLRRMLHQLAAPVPAGGRRLPAFLLLPSASCTLLQTQSNLSRVSVHSTHSASSASARSTAAAAGAGGAGHDAAGREGGASEQQPKALLGEG